MTDAVDKIPLVNLAAQDAAIRPRIDAAIKDIIDRTAFIGGEVLSGFEQSFATYCGADYCCGVSNGTDALVLALRAIDLQPGDIVITVPNSFIATTEAITLAGGVIRFVDVDPDTMLIDLAQLEDLVRTLRRSGAPLRAVIPVHLYGRPCPMDELMALAATHDFRVIEDAAQAHGAEQNGQRIGSIGDAACFSFYPGKNLGAYGDAGAVTTNDSDIAARVSKLRNHGRDTKYFHDIEGANCRMDAMQAAILSVKLTQLDAWTRNRIQCAAQYDRAFASGPVSPLAPAGRDRHVYHLYVVQVDNRDALQKHLSEAGISSGVHYPVPLHQQPAYSHLDLGIGSYPVTEAASSRILSLPLDGVISADSVSRVIAAVNDFFEAG